MEISIAVPEATAGGLDDCFSGGRAKSPQSFAGLGARPEMLLLEPQSYEASFPRLT
jgi:hypothetical protein